MASAPSPESHLKAPAGQPAAGERSLQTASKALRFVIAGAVLPLIVAFGLKAFGVHAQTAVSATITKYGGGVTAIAWSHEEGGPLHVGTQSGGTFRVAADGTVTSDEIQTPKSTWGSRGPIVALFPGSPAAPPRVIWLEGGAGDGSGDTLYRADGVPAADGLAIATSAAMVPVVALGDPATSGAAASPVNSPDQKGPGLQTVPSAGVGARMTAVGGFEVASRRFEGVLAGYDDGDVRVSDRQTGNALMIRSEAGGGAAGPSQGPIVRIAAVQSGSDPVRFVTGSGRGVFSLFEVQIADGTVARLASASVDRATTCDPTLLDARGQASGDRIVVLTMCADGDILIARPVFGQDGAAPDFRFRSFAPHGLLQTHTLPRSGSVILDLQRALAARGFGSGPRDGVLGAFTQRAFNEFRASLNPSEPAAVSQDEAIVALIGGRWRISAAALSPKSDLFAVAGNDGVVRVVVLPDDPNASPSAAETFEIRGHSDVITQLAISADGRHLASAGIDGRLWITDLNQARSRARLPFYGLPTGPAVADMAPMAIQIPGAAGVAGAKDFVVVFGTDTTLAAANDEIDRAKRAGFFDLGVYRLGDWFASVALFADARAQAEGLARLRGLSRYSAAARADRLSRLCPQPVSEDGATRCQTVQPTASDAPAQRPPVQQSPVQQSPAQQTAPPEKAAPAADPRPPSEEPKAPTSKG